MDLVILSNCQSIAPHRPDGWAIAVTKMLGLLFARQSGIDPPLRLKKAQSTLRAFNLDLSKQIEVEKVLDGAINSLDLDPVEDRYLLSGASDGTIAIHDTHNSKDVPACTYPHVSKVGRGHRNRHKFSVETVQWYPTDTGMFISSGTDKILKVWDTNTLKTADEYEFSGIVYSHNMSSVALLHSLIAVACQSNKVKLIDLKSGAATHVLRGHRKPVISVKWSTKNEFLLASGSEDSKVMIWDVRSSKGSLMVLDQHNGDTSAEPNSVNTAHNGRVNGICFTPDGLHLVTTGTDEEIRLWSVATGKNCLVNYGSITNDNVKEVGFSVTNSTSPSLVFMPSGSNIEVYDMYSGVNISTLRGHYTQVNCCLFRQDDQELLSGGNDRHIIVWTPMTDAVWQYEAHLREKEMPPEGRTKKNFLQRVGTADNWSSDED